MTNILESKCIYINIDYQKNQHNIVFMILCSQFIFYKNDSFGNGNNDKQMYIIISCIYFVCT